MKVSQYQSYIWNGVPKSIMHSYMGTTSGPQNWGFTYSQHRYLYFVFYNLTHLKRSVVKLLKCLHNWAGGIINTWDNFHLNLLEPSNRTVILQTSSAMLLAHTHRKQQTQAAVTRNRRRRRDHWWWYRMWLGWVRTSCIKFYIRVVFKFGQILLQCWPRS